MMMCHQGFDGLPGVKGMKGERGTDGVGVPGPKVRTSPSLPNSAAP